MSPASSLVLSAFIIVNFRISESVRSEAVQPSIYLPFEHWFVGVIQKSYTVIFESQFASFSHELEGWNQFLSTFRNVQHILAVNYVLVVEASYHHCASLS